MTVLAPIGAFVRRHLSAIMRTEAIPVDDKAPPPIVAPSPAPSLARTSPSTAGRHDRDLHVIDVEGDESIAMFGKPAPIEEPDTEEELRAHLDGHRRTGTIPLHEWKGKVV